MGELLLPADVADRARRSLARNLKTWVSDGAAATAASLTVRLGTPSEAVAAARRGDVQAWVHAWQSSPLSVRWEERRWPSLGLQLLPAAVSIDGARAIAAAGGRSEDWQRATARRARLLVESAAPHWPAATAAAFRYWNPLPDDDFARLLAVTVWLSANPRSGLLLRQLPIPGVDTKWLERHGAAVRSLVTALGVPENLGLAERAPLRATAILDPALRGGLPRLFAASDRELSELRLRPRRVVVIENLQSLEALGDLPGAVAVFGAGNAAGALAALPWVRAAADVVYWGDLDTAGLGILSRFRAARDCRSILMDRAALERWHELTVPDPAADPVDATHLTADEAAALDLLRRDGWRLEQERIPMAAAIEAIEAIGPA